MSKDGLKIITILGDSLSMVGPDAGITLRDLYWYKLQEKLGSEYYVIARNRRANNTKVQCDCEYLRDDILHNDSCYIVMHLGIVDCAPRLMARKERILLRLLHINGQNNFYVRFKSRHRRFFTRLFQWQIVAKNKFQENLEGFIASVRGSQHPSIKGIIVINIADTGEENKSRSFNYEKNILEYNSVISNIVNVNRDICSLIDMYEESKIDRKILLEDGMHLSISGHNLLLDLLYDSIIKREKDDSK
jgi:hypothetical protein